MGVIVTRSGRHINDDPGVLSPGELKTIKAARRIQPLEFVRSTDAGFVFLVRDPVSEKRREVSAPKTFDVNGEYYSFQGLYVTAKDGIIAFGARIPKERTDPQGLSAFVCELSQAEGDAARTVKPIAGGRSDFQYYASEGRLLLGHRIVGDDVRGLGIGNEMADRLEKHAAASGLNELVATSVFISGFRQQSDVAQMLQKRGYRRVVRENEAVDYARRLPPADEDFDMERFHKFPANPSGRREYHSEPIAAA